MVAASRSLRYARLPRLVLFTMLGAVTAGPLRAQNGFPHAAHEGLFPVCAGCHPAAAYDEGGLYPSASLCANCHDGKAYKSVRWTVPAVQRTSFQHLAHQRATLGSGKALDCSDCHGQQGADPMASVALSMGTGTACASCHRAHSADSNCSLCHTPAPDQHQRNAHAGCDGCHKRVSVDALLRTRTFCLLCHGDMTSHAAPRSCIECHPLGRVKG